MLRHTTLLILTSTTSIAAQATVCQRGPGVPFGITEYTCANCSSDKPAGQRRTYVFKDDPIVVERTDDSPFQPGDAITAVDGKGIVIPEGANSFAYPKPGPVVLQIKRKVEGKERLLYTVVNVSEACTIESATPPSATLPTILSGNFTVDSARLDSTRKADKKKLESCKRPAFKVENKTDATLRLMAKSITKRFISMTEGWFVDSVTFVVGSAPPGSTIMEWPRQSRDGSTSFWWESTSGDRVSMRVPNRPDVCLDDG